MRYLPFALWLTWYAATCSAAQRATAVKVATEIADIECTLAPFEAALATSLVTPSAQNAAQIDSAVNLADKGVGIACTYLTSGGAR